MVILGLVYGFTTLLIWLVVYLPLWKIMEFVNGIIVSNIWKNNPNVPNHQPVIIVFPWISHGFPIDHGRPLRSPDRRYSRHRKTARLPETERASLGLFWGQVWSEIRSDSETLMEVYGVLSYLLAYTTAMIWIEGYTIFHRQVGHITSRSLESMSPCFLCTPGFWHLLEPWNGYVQIPQTFYIARCVSRY